VAQSAQECLADKVVGEKAISAHPPVNVPVHCCLMVIIKNGKSFSITVASPRHKDGFTSGHPKGGARANVYHRHHLIHSCRSFLIVRDRGHTAKHSRNSAVHKHGQAIDQ
jgi:hypothetical protein